MAILVGTEEAGATSFAVTAGKAYCTKRLSPKTGTVTALALKVPATNKATKWRLGLFASGAGGEAGSEPGALLAETGEITVAGETATTVEGAITGVAIEKGVTYWLAWLILGATAGKIQATEKASWAFQTVSSSLTKLSEVTTFATSAPKFGEPLAVWGTGTEGGTTFTGSLLSRLAIVSAISGLKVAAAALATKAAFITSPTGRKVASGSLAGTTALRGTVTGSKTGAGALSTKVAVSSSVTGRKSTSATLSGQVAITTSLFGGLPAEGPTFSGSLLGALAISSVLTGRKLATGTLASRLAITTSTAGSKLAGAGLTTTLALQTSTSARKVGRGALTGTVALSSALTGRKSTTGTLVGTVAILTTLSTPSPEVFPATIRLSARSAVTITLTGRSAVSTKLTQRPAVSIGLTPR